MVRPTFRTVSLGTLLLLTGAAVGTYSYSPIATLITAALIAGFSEADNFCGTSHIASITQLREFKPSRHLWLGCASAYTVGGLATSLIVGVLLGSLPVELSAEGLWAIIGIAILLIARELGFLKFPLFQIRRQTHKLWADEFGLVTGAGMWGAHIGVGFATVYHHGGFYLVVTAAVIQEPLIGAVVYSCYWLGRTIPIWIAPIALRGSATDHIFEHVFSAEIVFRLAAIVAILLMTSGFAIALLR